MFDQLGGTQEAEQGDGEQEVLAVLSFETSFELPAYFIAIFFHTQPNEQETDLRTNEVSL